MQSPIRQKRSYAARVASPPKIQKIEVTPELQKLKKMAKNGESLDCATSEQIEDLLSLLTQESFHRPWQMETFLFVCSVLCFFFLM